MNSSIKLKIDFLILSKNVKVKIKEIVNHHEIGKIIFDSSNSDWKINKWKEECKLLGLKYYSVKENGALVMNL